MITIRQCAEFAGLSPDELILGVHPCARHHALLASYLLNMHRGAAAVGKMIACDLRSYLDLGAERYAADLVVVLRLFLAESDEIEDVPPLYSDTPRWDDGYRRPRANAPTRRKRALSQFELI